VPIERSQKNQVAILDAPPLARIPWLVHGFSTRRGGSSRVYAGRALNLGFTQHDSRSAVERNRAAFIGELGVAQGKNPGRSSPFAKFTPI